jgi:hypothetical protein
MVFNVVRVVRVEPGAMLDETVYDQWLHIEFGGGTVSVFDSELIAPEYASGEVHEVKLGIMATRVSVSNSTGMGISGNNYYGRVVSARPHDGLFEYIFDVNGLRIHLMDHVQHEVGEYLAVRGRLDLMDIKHPRPDSWQSV